VGFKNLVSSALDKVEGAVKEEKPITGSMKAIVLSQVLSCFDCAYHIKPYTVTEVVEDVRNPTRPGKMDRTYYGCPNPICGNYRKDFELPASQLVLEEKVAS